MTQKCRKKKKNTKQEAHDGGVRNIALESQPWELLESQERTCRALWMVLSSADLKSSRAEDDLRPGERRGGTLGREQRSGPRKRW